MMYKNFLTPTFSAQSQQNDFRPSDLVAEQEVDILARTLWGEARSEGKESMEAVASVILNRVQVARRHRRYWWGNTITQVCLKPYQFSCWNKNDPNYPKLKAVTNEDMHFMTALRVARRAVLGMVVDKTGGATHYHTIDIKPAWVRHEKPTIRIGRHLFYRLREVN
jgi:N-acetylmuramoyl-L-alanine amidase